VGRRAECKKITGKPAPAAPTAPITPKPVLPEAPETKPAAEPKEKTKPVVDQEGTAVTAPMLGMIVSYEKMLGMRSARGRRWPKGMY